MKIKKMQEENSQSFLMQLNQQSLSQKYSFFLQELKHYQDINEKKLINLQMIVLFDNLRCEQLACSKNAKIQLKLQTLKIIQKKVSNLEYCLSILKVSSSQTNKHNSKNNNINSLKNNQESLSDQKLLLQLLINKYHSVIIVLKSFHKKITFTKFITQYINEIISSQQNQKKLQSELIKIVLHIFARAQVIIGQMLKYDIHQKSQIKNSFHKNQQKFMDYFQLKDFQIYIQQAQNIVLQQIGEKLSQLRVTIGWNPTEAFQPENQQQISFKDQHHIQTLTMSFSSDLEYKQGNLLSSKMNYYKKVNVIRLIKYSLHKNKCLNYKKTFKSIISQIFNGKSSNIQGEQQILQLNSVREQQINIQQAIRLEKQQIQIQEDQKNSFTLARQKPKLKVRVTLNNQQSQGLFDEYFQKYYSNIFIYLAVEKQIYFKLKVPLKDKNFRQLGYQHLTWIPLKFSTLSSIQIIKASYIDYLSYLISLYFQNTVLYIKYSQQMQNREENDVRTLQDAAFFYNQKQNCLLFNHFGINKFRDIQHTRYHLKLLNNSFKIFHQQKQFIQEQQKINLLLTPIKQNTTTKNENNKDILISIPVRGKYCRHLDFFDLSQIYFHQIGKTVECPKCCEDVQFQQIIYLQQMQIIIQMIKLFYLQKNKFKLLKQAEYNMKSHQAVAWRINEEQAKQQPKELSELKMIVNHNHQTVKIRGSYRIISKDQYQNRQKPNPKKQQKIILQRFQFQLNQCYKTFCNPQIKFKNQAKSINKFLKSYGTSQFLLKTNQQNEFKQRLMKNIYQMNYLTKMFSFQEKIQLTKKYIEKIWVLSGQQTSETIQENLR